MSNYWGLINAAVVNLHVKGVREEGEEGGGEHKICIADYGSFGNQT